MATLSTLRNVVASKLGLDNAAASAEQVLIDEWLNQGVVEFLLRTHCTVEYATMDTSADVWKYQLDTSILAIKDIWREDAQSAVVPVERFSVSELLEYRRGVASSNAAFTKVAYDGANLLLVWPTPDAVYTLHLLYVPRPTAMSSAAHDPSDSTYGRIPTEFHKAIEYYALWQGAEYDESRTHGGGERFRALFEAECARARGEINMKGRRKLHPARLSNQRRVYITDPSQSWH